eukprot:TRINITY_DN6156_c5_g1_i1.p1 TRINITY_DN6156_c5_g1~~TRINITY_DN6156_c5_g1_i1.p1  ORF type:complete len:309 (+),score=53.45 TRINITY_DN6156_c5_g1_i1:29-955(+)
MPRFFAALADPWDAGSCQVHSKGSTSSSIGCHGYRHGLADAPTAFVATTKNSEPNPEFLMLNKDEFADLRGSQGIPLSREGLQQLRRQHQLQDLQGLKGPSCPPRKANQKDLLNYGERRLVQMQLDEGAKKAFMDLEAMRPASAKLYPRERANLWDFASADNQSSLPSGSGDLKDGPLGAESLDSEKAEAVDSSSNPTHDLASKHKLWPRGINWPPRGFMKHRKWFPPRGWIDGAPIPKSVDPDCAFLPWSRKCGWREPEDWLHPSPNDPDTSSLWRPLHPVDGPRPAYQETAEDGPAAMIGSSLLAA